MMKYSWHIGILLLTWFLFPATALAIAPPQIQVVQGITQSKMYFNDGSERMLAEISPWSLDTGSTTGHRTLFVSSYKSGFCTTPSNMFTLTRVELLAFNGTCRQVTQPLLSAATFSNASTLNLWRRDYYGAFTAHLIHGANTGSRVYTINHGEAKNNPGDPTIGLILPGCAPHPDIGYGVLPCEPAYAWSSYNAFISMASYPYNTDAYTYGPTVTHHGPILWPSNGYVESVNGGSTWMKASDAGLRHVYSIRHNNYLYLFYNDTSQGLETEGRGTGIKVSRAPITANGIDPQSFMNYYNGSFSEKSLPQGFTSSTYRNFLKTRGGRSTSLFPKEPIVLRDPLPGTKRTAQRKINEVLSFSVARIKGTGYFLGVGYDLSKGSTLRLSTDLINWSDPVVIPGTAANYWTGVDLLRVPLLYPIPANSNSYTNTEIDSGDFYVIGTQYGYFREVEHFVVNQIRLKFTSLPPLPSPTPTPSIPLPTYQIHTPTKTRTPTRTPTPTATAPKPGDANGDGVVDEADYTIWKSRYGQTVTGVANGDFNGDGKTDGVDFVVWMDNYGG